MVQVKQLVDYWCQHADAEAAADAARIDLRRFCDAATSLDDELIVHAALPAVGGAAFLDELKRLERQLYRADKQSGRESTLRQRRADALVEMAHPLPHHQARRAQTATVGLDPVRRSEVRAHVGARRGRD